MNTYNDLLQLALGFDLYLNKLKGYKITGDHLTNATKHTNRAEPY